MVDYLYNYGGFMLVKDMIKTKNRDLITIGNSENVLTAMKQLIKNKVSCLPVVGENNKLLGIISDKDIFKAVYENQDNFIAFKTGDLMSTNLIVGVEDDDLNYISGLMTKNHIRHIPIVNREKLIGLISIGDVVKANQENIEIENRYLKLYIDGNYPV